MDSMTWLGISMEELKAGIAKRQNRSVSKVGPVSLEVANIHESVHKAFRAYWENGVIDRSLNAEGYSIGKMMSEMEMTPIAAFVTLSWLIEEPEQARRGMALGTDTIITHD